MYIMILKSRLADQNDKWDQLRIMANKAVVLKYS